jgi:hypothetical protein
MIDNVAGLLKAVRPKAPEHIEFGELERNAYDDGYSAWVKIYGVNFKAFVSRREIDKDGASDALAAPVRALKKLFDDGVAEGRKRERDEEIRMLRTKQENAYRALRHKAMADAWNAIANGDARHAH